MGGIKQYHVLSGESFIYKAEYEKIRKIDIMRNLIQNELNEAKAFMLDIDGDELPVLSLRNAALVEAMIQNDSAYLKSTVENQRPTYKTNGEMEYIGSTAYWMTKLKQILVDEQSVDVSFEDVIKNAVIAVDRDNSTHLNADGVGRRELTERIISEKPNLLHYLRQPDETNLKLVKIISEKTNASKRARKNLSFASKFCHYACFYLFEGTQEQDNYSIYDYVAKKALPKYMSKYGYLKGEESRLEDYAFYRNVVDDIIAKSKSNISRNGFDHILWYYFKGRLQ